jgi:hypothetical protein
MEVTHAKLIQLKEQLEQKEALALVTQQLNMKLQAGEKLTDIEEDHRPLYTMKVYLDDEQERFKA